jgi:hypothetical protein
MGYREIVSAAKRLPLSEQLMLVEELLHTMRKSVVKPVDRRRLRARRFSELRGALKPEGAMPTDGELEDGYIKHLIEKYL